MQLRTWRARLDKRRAEHDQAMADWRVENEKLCQIAGIPEDLDHWSFRERIFNIDDIGSRKALIVHNLKLHKLTLSETYLDVELNQYRVEKAKTNADNWWMVPSFETALFCFASLGLERVKISPIVGAIAAAACGLMLGLNYRDVSIRQMREAVRQARSELREARSWLERRQRAPAWFSEVEAETGRPHVA